MHCLYAVPGLRQFPSRWRRRMLYAGKLKPRLLYIYYTHTRTYTRTQAKSYLSILLHLFLLSFFSVQKYIYCVAYIFILFFLLSGPSVIRSISLLSFSLSLSLILFSQLPEIRFPISSPPYTPWLMFVPSKCLSLGNHVNTGGGGSAIGSTGIRQRGTGGVSALLQHKQNSYRLLQILYCISITQMGKKREKEKKSPIVALILYSDFFFFPRFFCFWPVAKKGSL